VGDLGVLVLQPGGAPSVRLSMWRRLM
jgi:hypothetical protein